MEALDQLQASVERLLREMEGLRQRNAELEQEVERQYREIVEEHAKIVKLEGANRNLMVAHALSADSPNRQRAKNRLSVLINEVDRAMAILKK